MSARRLLLLLPLVACETYIEPDANGVYVLSDTYGMTLECASGGASCDWLSEDDWDLTAEQAPGYCVTTATIDGPAPDPRTLIYYDTTGETPLGTYGDDVVVDEITATTAQVTINGVGDADNNLVIDIVWGDPLDPNTWEPATIALTPVRWTL